MGSTDKSSLYCFWTYLWCVPIAYALRWEAENGNGLDFRPYPMAGGIPKKPCVAFRGHKFPHNLMITECYRKHIAGPA
jgi:hypothetical protein